jgi:hypothetical protein
MRILFRVTQSYWLHVLMLALIVHAYNRTAYQLHWVTGRGAFSDVAAPLYASTEYWVRDAIDEGRLADAIKPRLHYLIAPVAIAAGWIALAGWQFRAARTLPWWVLTPVALAFVLAMNITTAMINGGTDSLSGPFRRYDLEYYGYIDVVRDDPAQFIRNYVQLGDQLCHHARTHPPGAVLFLWFVGKLFGEGVMTASVVTVVVSSLTIIPAIGLAWDRGNPRVAWTTAALYVVTPTLVLFGATCMDGVFAVLPVTGMWLLNRAIARNSPTYAVFAGLAFSGALFFTYAVAILGMVYAILLLMQLRFGLRALARMLLLFLIVLAVIVLSNALLYWTIGYDPVACLRSAVDADAHTMSRIRSRPIDVGFANLMAFIIGAGVVSVVAWWHHVARQTWLIACRHSHDAWDLALLIGIVASAFLGWFTLETERIWLLLIPPLLVGAAAALAGRGRSWPQTVALVLVLFILLSQTILSEFFLNTWW